MDKVGNNMFFLAKELWPINRSITGVGIRETLNKIANEIPVLKLKKFEQVLKYLIGLFQMNGMLMMHLLFVLQEKNL